MKKEVATKKEVEILNTSLLLGVEIGNRIAHSSQNTYQQFVLLLMNDKEVLLLFLVLFIQQDTTKFVELANSIMRKVENQQNTLGM